MRSEIRDLLTAERGVTTRAALLRTVTRNALEHAVAAGHVARLHPAVYVDPDLRADPTVRLRGALAYVGVPAAASHTTGLWVWNLLEQPPDEVHLVTDRRAHRRSGRGLLVHRWWEYEPGPPHSVERKGFPVISLERCLVDSWPLLPAGPERRAPLLEAVGSRRTTAARVQRALEAAPRLTGRGELRGLLDRVGAGCRSELELWSYDHVFRGREFEGVLRQYAVHLEHRTVYLDLAFADVKVAVELDGAAWHGASDQRERDVRRDSELAALGWVVLRVTHRRLHEEPAAVRAEVLSVLRERRRQLAA